MVIEIIKNLNVVLYHNFRIVGFILIKLCTGDLCSSILPILCY
jgi:hypothetical protein